MKPRDLNSLNQYTTMKTELESVVTFVRKLNYGISAEKINLEICLDALLENIDKTIESNAEAGAMFKKQCLWLCSEWEYKTPLHLQSPELITFLFNNLPKV